MLDTAREANFLQAGRVWDNQIPLLDRLLISNKREKCRVWWKNNPDHQDIPELRTLLPVGYHVNNWPRT
jgi:hypothetical protein